MKINNELKEKLNLPDVSQVGIVVKDLDKAIAYYEDNLGLGPFVRLSTKDVSYTEKFYYNKPIDSVWIMGFCSLGPVELEIVQPVTGPTIYHDFLRAKGEGIHHLGFDIKDMDEKLMVCKKMGIEIMQSGRTPAGGFAYLNTEKIGGVIFELIQRKSRRA